MRSFFFVYYSVSILFVLYYLISSTTILSFVGVSVQSGVESAALVVVTKTDNPLTPFRLSPSHETHDLLTSSSSIGVLPYSFRKSHTPPLIQPHLCGSASTTAVARLQTQHQLQLLTTTATATATPNYNDNSISLSQVNHSQPPSVSCLTYNRGSVFPPT